MKKQNVNSKLAFNKIAITELNNSQLMQVNGGSLDALGDIAGYIYDAGREAGKWISKQVEQLN